MPRSEYLRAETSPGDYNVSFMNQIHSDRMSRVALEKTYSSRHHSQRHALSRYGGLPWRVDGRVQHTLLEVSLRNVDVSRGDR